MSAMDTALPVDVATLQKMVRELSLGVEARDATIGEQKRALRTAQQRIDHLLRRLFVRTSEKLDPKQLAMSFAEATAAINDAAPPVEEPNEVAAADDEAPVPPKKKRTPHGRKPLPANIERRRVEIPPVTTCCPDCAKDLVRIGEEVTEELGYEPARRFVTEHVRGKYVCRECEKVAETAPLPERAADRVRPGATVLADLVVKKYDDHLPLARQEKILAREGIEISRSTLCDWVGLAARLLAPIGDEIRKDVLAASVMHGDDTPIQVQENWSRGKSIQGRLWIYRNPAGDTLFDFRRSRSREGPMEVLANWKGHFVCDAYAGYHALFKGGSIVPISCWAHARRKYYDAFQGGDVDAAIVLTLIGRLYQVEADAKERGLDGEATRALRQERSKPEIDTLATVLEHLAKDALPKSPLGEAVSYTRTLWPSLLRYLDDGRFPIDNNPAENAIRAVALGRKNWLFAGGDEGGHRAALLYSIVSVRWTPSGAGA
ncbi:MAG: IS66 family transposase [Planctomycetes bacterium]|nr:IS66 family transposase [Planctomycetota bacterium]